MSRSTHDRADRFSRSFWDFSLAVYAVDGVKEACLALQDEGLDVNMALWIVWIAATGRDARPALQAALERSEAWSAAVVRPLRAARDGLKPAPDMVDADAAQALRRAILAVELEAERLQQEALQALAPQAERIVAEPPWTIAAVSLEAYAALRGPSAPVTQFLETVSAAVEKV